MANKVIYLNNVTRLDIPADRVLNGIPEMKSVVILGYDTEGQHYFASSIADGGDVLWLMEKLKLILMNVGASDA